MIQNIRKFMNKFLRVKFCTIVFCLVSSLVAQFDPSTISRLSSLTAEQRERMLESYKGSQYEKSVDEESELPSPEIGTEKIEVERPSVESFDDRSDFLGDLGEMEEVIAFDIIRLEDELTKEGTASNNELLEALEESRALLRKIKVLQRREIEKRAEEYAKSEFDAIKPFGYDLFAASPSTFAPGNEVPMPSDYRVGPGDLIDIQLFGKENLSHSILISREGFLGFPGIGPINAFEKGTRFVDLKNHLKEKILENFGGGVQSSITLGGFRSIRIFLMGEVRNPGSYTVSALSTKINALIASGGIKETGSLRKVQLKRSGKLISTLDLYDLLLKGDTSGDSSLQPGDVVFVPVLEKQVSVTGAVRRPAKFEILGGETLEEVIDLAGGPGDRSFLDFIRFERLGEDFRPEVKNLKFPLDASFQVKSGDVISLGVASGAVTNSVSLIGSCERVGDYEWKPDLTLKNLIKGPMDLASNADLEYGLIRRKLPEGKITCLYFSPNQVISGKSNISLEKQDLVYFFAKEPRNKILEGLIRDLRSQSSSGQSSRLVRISGVVHYPGEYPLSEKMTLQNLIQAGGGMKDSAYVLNAELTRIRLQEDQTASIEHIRIDQSMLEGAIGSEPFYLQPYDSLLIKPIPSWREQQQLEIRGEVQFPGSYLIKPGETLGQLLKRAGGLTEQAYPKGAIFSRQGLRKKEDEQRLRLIERLETDLTTASLNAKKESEVVQAQSAANGIISRLRASRSQGRLVIDLSAVLQGDKDTDLLVKDGDTLFIPDIPYSVSVSGEIQFPTSHLHNEKLDLNDYLKRSGGFTANADEERTFVVKANGSVLSNSSNAWFSKSKRTNAIEPGDFIVVPIDITQSRFLENISNGTQIIYQLAVAAAAVNSF